MRHQTALAVLCTLGVAASLAYLNLDGYQKHLVGYFGPNTGIRGTGNFTGEPPDINWVHGWPIGCAVRNSVRQWPSQQIPWKAGFASTSRWPFDGTPVAFWSPFAACIDLGFGVLAGVGTFVCANSVASILQLRVQFKI